MVPRHPPSQSAAPVMRMLALLRDVQPDDAAPVIVHCSAGCGRTGSLVAIDYIWNLLKVCYRAARHFPLPWEHSRGRGGGCSNGN